MELRNKGMLDADSLTDEELALSELTDAELNSGKIDGIYRLKNIPVCSEKTSKYVDRRDVYGKLGEKNR